MTTIPHLQLSLSLHYIVHYRVVHDHTYSISQTFMVNSVDNINLLPNSYKEEEYIVTLRVTE